MHPEAHPIVQRLPHEQINVRALACFVALHQHRQNVAVGEHACSIVGNRGAAFFQFPVATLAGALNA